MNQKFKQYLTQLSKALITILVLAFIVHKNGWEKISTTITSAQPGWIMFGIFIFVISILLGGLQWHSLLQSRGINLPRGKTMSVYFTGIFFNNFMLGMVAGDSYKVAHLHFNNEKIESGFAATFFDRIAGLLVISLFALAGGIYFFTSGKAGTENLNIILLTPVLFATALFIALLIFLSKRLQSILMRTVARIPYERVRGRIETVLQELFIDRHDKKERKTFLTVLFYSFWIQLLRVLVHVAAALSLGIYYPGCLQYFLIVVPIISILTIIPLPFGVKETIGASLFISAGFSDNETALIVMEFLAMLMGIGGSLFGAITFILDKKRKD